MVILKKIACQVGTQSSKGKRIIHCFAFLDYPNPKIEPPNPKNTNQNPKKLPHSSLASIKIQTTPPI